MTTTAAMHFGPEWMRAKPHSTCTTRQQQQPSPPPQPLSNQLSPSTYSALVTPVSQEPDRRDESRPFRYTKDDMLRIYKEGGGRGGLNLEVARWEGIVRDVGNEPVGLREMSEAEKKLFAGPLNSELRRRQSTDFMSMHSSDRRGVHPNSATNNSTRYGPFSARRRDSTDQPPLSLPRKLSLSNTQGATLSSPRDALPSPRNRIGPFGTGFDGVLTGGDSWSRRRPSASMTGSGGGTSVRGESKEEDARRSEIKEEEESVGRHSPNSQDNDSAALTDRSSSPGPDVFPPDVRPGGSVSLLKYDSVGRGKANPSLEAHPTFQILSANSPLSSGPPGLTDPASTEWSYLDPQGHVQGPFRADLMQKWFDEGYFTPDLLMKRTHIDVDWTAVGILEIRAAGGKIFLPRVSNGPPGLAIRTESPKGYSPAHEQNMFDGYQTLRTTIDSLNGSSPIESSSSSLGDGRFRNDSPDLSILGGRTGGDVYSGDADFGGRTFAMRAAFQDSISDSRAFSNNLLGRASTIDTFNAYSAGGDSSPWSAGSGKFNQGSNDNDHHPYANGFNGMGSGTIGNPLSVSVHGVNQEHFGDTTYGGVGSHHESPVARRPSDVNGIPLNSSMADGFSSSFGTSPQFSQSTPVPYAAPQQRQSTSPFGDLIPQSTEGHNVTQTPTSAVQPNSPLPWTTHSRAIEPVAPSPVLPPARPQALGWATPQPDPSPWLMASLPVVDDVWREMPGPNSLTFSNLGQHNKLQEQEEDREDDIVVSPIEGTVPSPDTQPEQPESTNTASASATAVVSPSFLPEIVSASPGTQGSTAPKARRKSTTRDVQSPTTKATVPLTPTVIKDPPTPSLLVQSKPVWATEDDLKKQKGAGAPVSLREIQEAEVKKAEARKAAEKERERFARVNVASDNVVVEESQPLVSSWGLPTSQAGARNPIPPRESSISNSTITSPAPVWTNANPPPIAKRTMKEIQEEEERRKKLGVKESMASAANRRAYAETTVKVVSNVQASGGSWTTVGPNGKPTSPAMSTPRPPVNTSPNNSTSSTVQRSNSTATRPTVTTVKVATPRVEDFPVTPSHDFIKWLGESLKGLNSSVNLEEITSMLLSFPLDPDQSTLEIISDLIYANSTTLDGRRFASEYVSKRKVDASTRRGTAGAPGPGSKPVSIADVVKTQPKPVQQEWGFKVVNKKKKGGR